MFRDQFQSWANSGLIQFSAMLMERLTFHYHFLSALACGNFETEDLNTVRIYLNTVRIYLNMVRIYLNMVRIYLNMVRIILNMKSAFWYWPHLCL